MKILNIPLGPRQCGAKRPGSDPFHRLNLNSVGKTPAPPQLGPPRGEYKAVNSHKPDRHLADNGLRRGQPRLNLIVVNGATGCTFINIIARTCEAPKPRTRLRTRQREAQYG